METAYIEYFNSTDQNIGYNLCIFSTDRTGFKHSYRTKRKMSKNSPRYLLGKKLSLETRKKISEARIGKSLEYLKKPIKQIDIQTGAIVKIWPSATDASLHFCGKKHSSIRYVCNKCYVFGKKNKNKKFKYKTAYGFRWEYV